MKIILSLVGFLFLINIFGTTQQQQRDSQACGFTVQGEPTHATVTGPDDIVPLVYVIEQPDSPIEILSVNLQGMWLSVSDEHLTARHCAKYKVRNRSDQIVQRFDIELLVQSVAGGGGSGTRSSSPLAPGQTIEIGSCNGGGSGGARENRVKVLVSVHFADFGDCFYRPSQRIPRNLGVKPEW
jgi:hypothetical protein